MALTRRGFIGGAAVLAASACAAGTLSACSSQTGTGSSEGNVATPEPIEISSAKWSYDSDNGVYYQIGVYYCTAPVATDCQKHGHLRARRLLRCAGVPSRTSTMPTRPTSGTWGSSPRATPASTTTRTRTRPR